MLLSSGRCGAVDVQEKWMVWNSGWKFGVVNGGMKYWMVVWSNVWLCSVLNGCVV